MKVTLTIEDEYLKRLKELSRKTGISLKRLLEDTIKACAIHAVAAYETLVEGQLRIENEETKFHVAVAQAIKIGNEFYRTVIIDIFKMLGVLGHFIVNDISLEDKDLWLGLAGAHDSDLHIDWMDIVIDIDSGEGEITAYCYLDEEVPDEILERMEKICGSEISGEGEDEDEEEISYLLGEIEDYGGRLEVDRELPAIVVQMATESYEYFPDMREVSDLIGEILEKSEYLKWLGSKTRNGKE